jgi:hypothetical protein
MQAAAMVGVDPEKIIAECAVSSQYCPTDAELLSVARGIRGPAEAPPVERRGKCPYGKCDGEGWRLGWALHTQETGANFRFKRREWITEEQANILWPKIDKQSQVIYEGAARCKCAEMAGNGNGRLTL